MNSASQLSEQLTRVFNPSPSGVVGLVDDLLRLCPEPGLQFEWQDDRCHVYAIGDRVHEVTKLPLSRSVFRAILARIAVLCNETVPNSASPYGGSGEVSLCTEPPTFLAAAFTNTPDEQRLELKTLAHANGSPSFQSGS
jgi:hypothetical protein